MIRPANRDNIREIAECHRAAFPGSFSSALGLAYVKKMLEWYVEDESAFLLFLREENKCIGYCGGMVRSKPGMGSASSMAQYSFNQAILSILVRPWLIFHRELRAKYIFVLRNIWHKIVGTRREKRMVTESAKTEPYVALVVIGVRSELQGKGYGSQLLKAFENKVIDLGYTKMLLTVISDNKKAIKAYERNGWVITQIRGKSTSMEKVVKT